MAKENRRLALKKALLTERHSMAVPAWCSKDDMASWREFIQGIDKRDALAKQLQAGQCEMTRVANTSNKQCLSAAWCALPCCSSNHNKSPKAASEYIDTIEGSGGYGRPPICVKE